MRWVALMCYMIIICERTDSSEDSCDDIVKIFVDVKE